MTTAAAPAKTTELRLFPVSIESFDARLLEMDLYLKPAPDAPAVLYRTTGIEFSLQDRQRLMEQHIEFLYIPMSQHKAYRRLLSDRVEETFHDPHLQRVERARLIRASCKRMIEDVLIFPNQPEPIAMIADMSRKFATWATEDPQQFSYLLDMSGHDYYTTLHMVSVGVGCGLLVNELRPGDEELRTALVEGGMLHDIGKRGIPAELLNKEGKLAPDEWQTIRRHPLIGADELRNNPAVPAFVIEMVRDHHERPDGTGYPEGLRDARVSFAARICAVVDVFDAICAARPYRGPTPPQETLRIMREGRGKHFDSDIFDAWAAIVERLVCEDPSRAPASTGEPSKLSLGALGQQAPLIEQDIEPRDSFLRVGEEQRRHPRHECNVPVRVRFIYHGKPLPVLDGEWTEVRMMDISQGGARLRTAWPLSRNDVVEIELPGTSDRARLRRGRVVSIRSVGADGWDSGIRFVKT